MGQHWETLMALFRRMRIRIGDVAWAAVQPARSKLHAGHLRFTDWRRRRADALWAAKASLRASWQGASGRRRATVGVLALLPFAMASGVTAMVLPAGGDPRAGAPAQERVEADAPSKQSAQKATTATASSRAERPKPARAAAGGAGSAESAAVSSAPAATRSAGGQGGGSSVGSGVDSGSGSGGDSGSGSGGDSAGGAGGDAPVDDDAGSRGGERHTSAAPAPPARTRRLPAGGSDERFRPTPGPPAAKTPAPQTEAPAASAPAPAAPVTEPAPVIEPDADFEEDSDNDEGDGPGNSDRRGPPPDRGGGNDEDEDEDKDP